MKSIKNYEIIEKQLDNFDWINLKYIEEVQYRKCFNNFYGEEFFLDLSFVLAQKNDRYYNLKIRFKKISQLELFISGSYIQLIGFDIVDIKDDGWCELRYKVYDYERDDIKFYCDEIEILSLEERKDQFVFLKNLTGG